jgi:hypothetical protein
MKLTDKQKARVMLAVMASCILSIWIIHIYVKGFDAWLNYMISK